MAVADIRYQRRPSVDVQIHNEGLYSRVFAQGQLGIGESYVDGWWDCEQLDEMVCRAYRARFHRRIRPVHDVLFTLQARLMNLQQRRRAFQVGEHHYDLSNDLFRRCSTSG